MVWGGGSGPALVAFRSWRAGRGSALYWGRLEGAAAAVPILRAARSHRAPATAAAMWRVLAAVPARALLRTPPARRAASLAVSPAAGPADERVETRVAGLSPGQPVTLRAVAADDGGCLFQSCAHYRADSRGELHLGTDASHGGDYTGVEPMGLFWSLAPAGMEKPYQRLVPRNTGAPMKVEVLVHQGHSPPGSMPGPVVAKAEVQRLFTTPGVRRIRLKEGVVRGSLFLPPGECPGPRPSSRGRRDAPPSLSRARKVL